MAYQLPTKLRWMLQDEMSRRGKRDEDLLAQQDRLMAAQQEAAEMPLRLKQMEIDSEKDKEITRRGDAATADLERGRAISNVMSGHLSPTEYSMRYGQALPASGGGSRQSGNALGQATVKPGDTLDANTEALKMVNNNYIKMKEAAINPVTITPDMLDPATGKLWAQDKYIKNNYAPMQALLGAGGQNTEETLADIHARERFHNAAEALNTRENTVLSKVDENGAPIGANEKGFTNYSLTGVDDAGMPVLNPNGALPENSIVRQGLSPKSNAIKTTSGNTTKTLKFQKPSAMTQALTPAQALAPTQEPPLYTVTEEPVLGPGVQEEIDAKRRARERSTSGAGDFLSGDFEMPGLQWLKKIRSKAKKFGYN